MLAFHANLAIKACSSPCRRVLQQADPRGHGGSLTSELCLSPLKRKAGSPCPCLLWLVRGFELGSPLVDYRPVGKPLGTSFSSAAITTHPCQAFWLSPAATAAALMTMPTPHSLAPASPRLLSGWSWRQSLARVKQLNKLSSWRRVFPCPCRSPLCIVVLTVTPVVV